jgi:hypothetical protein
MSEKQTFTFDYALRHIRDGQSVARYFDDEDCYDARGKPEKRRIVITPLYQGPNGPMVVLMQTTTSYRSEYAGGTGLFQGLVERHRSRYEWDPSLKDILATDWFVFDQKLEDNDAPPPEEELGSLLYPEHEKLQKRLDDATQVMSFLDWLTKNDLAVVELGPETSHIQDREELIPRFLGLSPELLALERKRMEENDRHRGEY